MNKKDIQLISEAYNKTQVQEAKLSLDINDTGPEKYLFRKEKLAKEFAMQYNIDPDDPMYPTILNAFAIGYSFGVKDTNKQGY